MAGKGYTSNFLHRNGQSEKPHPSSMAFNHVDSPDEASEDEVVGWLQYPTEDFFDRNYCSDPFGPWPSGLGKVLPTNATDAGTSRLPGGVGNFSGTRIAGVEDRTGVGAPPRATSAEAALALGAERASGLISQSGQEVFSKVKTAMQPPVVSHVGSLQKNRCSFEAPLSFSQTHCGKSGLSTDSSSKLPPRSRSASSLSYKLPLQPTQVGLHTVHNSPVPNAIFRADASAAGPSSNGPYCKYDQERMSLRDRSAFSGSTCGSTVSGQSNLPSSRDSRRFSFAHMQVVSSQPSACSHITEESTLKPVGSPPHRLVHTVPGNSSPAERLASAFVEPQRPENEIDLAVSRPGGSLAEGDVSRKRASSIGKHKLDHSDCQSEDAEGESVEIKERPKRPSSKRHRAAEVHNLSERKRRDRINNKMKALQDLIPNSNKTDKASVLDEAIEYLKMLQLQIQVISMRSGMSLSPMMIPVGMPHLQMAQLTPVGLGVPVGHAGVGMGMGMGVGMDYSQSVTAKSFQSLPSSFSHFGIPCQPAMTVDSEKVKHPSHNPEFSFSDFSSSEQGPSQLSQPMHADQQNLLFYHLQQQQNQQLHNRLPGGSPSNAISDSSNEQTDK